MAVRSLPLIRIFIASPSDVPAERAFARNTVKRAGEDPLITDRATLKAVTWDDPDARTPFPVNLSPQEAINRGLARPSECDIVIVIFWARMGTPLRDLVKSDGSPYGSGTEWEFEDAMRSRAQVLLYRRTEEPVLKISDRDRIDKIEQYDRVQEFFERLRHSDAPNREPISYGSTGDFESRFDHDLRTVLKPLINSLHPGSIADSKLTTYPGIPYPGLRAFTTEESPVFFGRGREVDELVRKLSDARFLAVIGASGVGKSSAVAAGLLPRLRANVIEGSKDWVVVRFSPAAYGDNPLLALSARLADLTPADGTPARIADMLAAKPHSAANLVDSILGSRPEWSELLIVIDQMEELLTSSSPASYPVFIAVVVALAQQKRTRIVVTLRADFFGRFADSIPLRELLQSNHYILLQPGYAAIREMVVRPAEQVGLSLEAGLDSIIVEDAGAATGSLPLLAFMLNALFLEASDKHLTISMYERLGRIGGAIGRRAAETLQSCDPAILEALPILFRELVRVGENGAPARRRAETEAIRKSPAVWELAKRLVDARLLVADAHDSIETLEVAHEAIFENWPDYREWITEHRAFLQWEERIRVRAAEWSNGGRDPSLLLAGRLLHEARGWRKNHQAELSGSELSFLDESLARARDQQRKLIGLRLSESMQLMLRSPGRSERAVLLLALESMRLSVTPEARQVLRQYGAKLMPLLASFPHPAAVREMAFGPNFNALYTVGSDAVLRVWNTSTGVCETEFALGGEVTFTRFSDGAELLAVARADDSVTVYRSATNEQVMRRQHIRAVLAMCFSYDGRALATAGDDCTAQISLLRESPEVLIHPAPVTAVALSSDSATVVTAAQDGVIRLWSPRLGSSAQVRPAPHCIRYPGVTIALATSRDGERLSVATEQSLMTLPLTRPTFRPLLQPRNDHGSGGRTSLVRRFEFSPDGFHLCARTADGAVSLWHSGSGLLAARVPWDHVASASSVDHDGTHVATGSAGAVHIWTAQPARDALQLTNPSGIDQITTSSDGRLLAAAAGYTARVWSADKGKNLGQVSLPRAITAVGLDADGTLLAVAMQQRIIVVPLADWGRRSLPACPEPVVALAFSPNGQLRALAATSGWACWSIDPDGARPQWARQSILGSAAFTGSALSVDGEFFAAVRNREFLVLKTSETEEISPVQSGRDARLAAISMDGSLVAGASLDTVWICSAKGEPVRDLRMPAPVTGLTFTTDQRHLIVACGADLTWHTISDDDLITEVSSRMPDRLSTNDVRSYAKVEAEELELIADMFPTD